MTTNLKTFKTYRAARKAAPDQLILRVGNLYLIGFNADGLDSIEATEANGRVVGNVTIRHLKRLGNANWAQPGTPGRNLIPVALKVEG